MEDKERDAGEVGDRLPKGSFCNGKRAVRIVGLRFSRFGKFNRHIFQMKVFTVGLIVKDAYLISSHNVRSSRIILYVSSRDNAFYA